MKIGTRMPGFGGQIGFDAYAEWLSDSGFTAVDTPPLTRQIAQTCQRSGLAIGTCDGRAGGLLSVDPSIHEATSSQSHGMGTRCVQRGATC